MFISPLQLSLCSLTANTPRPVAASWETEEGETYLHLFTEQGTLQPLSNAGLCRMPVWTPALAKTQEPWGFPEDVAALLAECSRVSCLGKLWDMHRSFS